MAKRRSRKSKKPTPNRRKKPFAKFSTSPHPPNLLTALTADGLNHLTDASLAEDGDASISEAPVYRSADQIRDRIGDYLKPFVPNNQFQIRTVVADTRYLCVPLGFVLSVINNSPWLAPASYRDDVFDCDDYAQYLKVHMSQLAQQKGYPAPFTVGFIITTRHAFNFCIDPSGALVVIDTQRRERGYTADIEQFPTFLEINPNDLSNIIQAIYI